LALNVSLTSLRCGQQTVNDDLAEFHRIYIRNRMQWKFFFVSARKNSNGEKKAKMWVREPTIGALAVCLCILLSLSFQSTRKLLGFYGSFSMVYAFGVVARRS
jgi:hypothetical protein